MAQEIFIPTSGSTHNTFRAKFNNNAVDAENRLSALEFSLFDVTGSSYTQVTGYTHYNYNDDTAFGGGGGPLYVDLLSVSQHSNVTVHKKIGSSADVVLVPPSGVKIDGITGDGSTNGYHLTSKYESVSIYTDGNDYFIQ